MDPRHRISKSESAIGAAPPKSSHTDMTCVVGLQRLSRGGPRPQEGIKVDRNGLYSITRHANAPTRRFFVPGSRPWATESHLEWGETSNL